MNKPITTLASLMISGSALTGVVRADSPRVGSPAVYDSAGDWNWFLGASVAYLFDYDEPMYSLNAGVTTPWSPAGWNTSIYVEIGLMEDDNESEIPLGVPDIPADLQIVPVMANLRFERALTDHVGLYFGGGAGAAFAEIIIDQEGRDQDTVFAAQVFAGINFRLGANSEIHAGGRWMYFDDTANYNLTDDWAVELGYRWKF